jgi:hypothetical protein
LLSKSVAELASGRSRPSARDRHGDILVMGPSLADPAEHNRAVQAMEMCSYSIGNENCDLSR